MPPSQKTGRSHRQLRNQPYQQQQVKPRIDDTYLDNLSPDEQVHVVMLKILATHSITAESLLSSNNTPVDDDAPSLLRSHADQLKSDYEQQDTRDRTDELDVLSIGFSPRAALEAAMLRDGVVKLPSLAKPMAGIKKWKERYIDGVVK